MDYSKFTKEELIAMLQEDDVKRIKKSSEAANAVRKIIKKWNQENMVLLCLNSSGKIIKSTIVYIGTLNQTIIHPREIFFEILQAKCAASFILAHNHPSGSLLPSSDDDIVCKRLRECSKIMGFEMIDFLIVTQRNHFSYTESGQI